MLTKSANEENNLSTQNDLCESKTAHRTANETTSGDEPTTKSSPPIEVNEPEKTALKSSIEVDLSLQKQTSRGANEATASANTSNEILTPPPNKTRLKGLR